MQIIDKKRIENIKPSVACIGFFDGLHKGHHFLLNQVKGVAKEKNLASAVVTFPEHPAKVVNPQRKVELLTLCDEKVELLAAAGIDYCFIEPFTTEVSKLTARQFMEQVLKERYAVEVLIIGYDHQFGHNRAEGFTDYCKYGKELGIEVVQATAYYEESVDVSSSAIRNAIKEGDVSLAQNYLGYNYFVEGKVVDGMKIGRTIGFPTANIEVTNEDKLIPRDGVYAVRVLIEGDEQLYWGMLNIGNRPTMNNGSNRSIEVNILDFNSDVYQQKIRLLFVERLRDELYFDSIEKLIDQLHLDEAQVRSMII